MTVFLTCCTNYSKYEEIKRSYRRLALQYHPDRNKSPETTRLGMEGEMKEIAGFIKRVVVDRQDSAAVAKDVAGFRKQFQKVQYAFDNAVKAYEYISLTSKR